MPRHYVAVFLLVSAWTFSFDEEKLPDPLIFFGNQAALRINSSRWVSAQSHKALQNKKYLKALDGYAYLYRNGDVWHEKRIYRLIEKEGLSPLLDLLTPTKPNSKMKPSTGTSAEEKAHFLDFLRYTRSFLKSPSFSYGGSNPYVMAFMTMVNPAVASAKGGFSHLNDPYGVYALLQTLKNKPWETPPLNKHDSKIKPLLYILNLAQKPYQPHDQIFESWPLLALAIRPVFKQKLISTKLLKTYPFLIFSLSHIQEKDDLVKEAIVTLLNSSEPSLEKFITTNLRSLSMSEFISNRLLTAQNPSAVKVKVAHDKGFFYYMGSFTRKELARFKAIGSKLYEQIKFLPRKSLEGPLVFCKQNLPFVWDTQKKTGLLSYQVLAKDQADLIFHLAKAFFFNYVVQAYNRSDEKLFPLWLPTSFTNHFFSSPAYKVHLESSNNPLLYPLTPTTLLTLPYQSNTLSETTVFEKQCLMVGRILFKGITLSAGFEKLADLLSTYPPPDGIISEIEENQLKSLMGYQ